LSIPFEMPKKVLSNVRGRKSAGEKYCPFSVPDEQFLTFEYADQINASAAANLYQYQWRTNSCFDPNLTATGAQPVGWDEWSALYSRYTVEAVEYDYSVYNRTAGSTASVCSTLLPSATAPTDFFAAAGMRLSKVAYTQYGSPPARVSGKATNAVIAGVDPMVITADDAYSAAVSANPSRDSVLTLSIETAGATDTLTIAGRIKYKVRLWAPKVLATS